MRIKLQKVGPICVSVRSERNRGWRSVPDNVWLFRAVRVAYFTFAVSLVLHGQNMDSASPKDITAELTTRETQISNSLQAMTRAVNAGDARTYAKLYTQDAVIKIYGGDRIVGRRAIELYELALLHEFPGTRLAFYEIWIGRSQTVVHYGVNGKTQNGKAMGHEGLLFYRFDPLGNIVEERRYNDSLTPMAQLGLFGHVPTRALPSLPTQPILYYPSDSKHETQNVGVVKECLAILKSRDESKFMQVLAKDPDIDDFVLPSPFQGREGAKTWFQGWTNAFNIKTQSDTIFAVGDFVFVESTLRGTLQHGYGPMPGSDRPFEAHRAAVFQVTDGKIQSILFFMNGKELDTRLASDPPKR